MARSKPINIVMQPSNDKAAINAAKITATGAVIAALIICFGSVLVAVVTILSNLQQKTIDCCWIRRDDWRQVARDNGWIPRAECPWLIIIGTGKDDDNQTVKVKIHLLSGEYRWVCGSSTQAELGDEPVDLASHIQGLNIDPQSKIIVAVGMASVEGDFIKQAQLSEERVDKLITLIREKLNKELNSDIPVHGLSLGRYKDEKTKSTCRATSDQRRVVVVEILERQGEANLEEAVYDALKNAYHNTSARIPFDVTNYKEHRYTDHTFGY